VQSFQYTENLYLSSGNWLAASHSNYETKGLSYDNNGNIKALKRYDGTSGLMHDLSYSYKAAPYSNQLASVKAGSNTYASYQYNQIGQMVQQTQGSNTVNVGYSVQGLVTEFKDASYTIKYHYDDLGQRYRKEQIGGKSTWYVRDANGSILAIYEQESNESSPQLEERPVYGASRIGYYNASKYHYELKDHLGNVRVVFSESNNLPSLGTYASYYPFGLKMKKGGLAHRYGYQGEYAEDETEETGWNAFEARMYDPVIGRWVSIDPARQYASPYVGNGNNPISILDPDGRTGVPIEGEDGKVSYLLPELTFTASGSTKSYSQGFWDLMAHMDNVITCKTCVDKNPWPVQVVFYGNGKGNDEYLVQPNPWARTIAVDYDDIKSVMDLVDQMLPDHYNSSKSTLTELRNSGSGTSTAGSINKMAVEQKTTEVHSLVNKYNEELVKLFKPDSTPIRAEHSRGALKTWSGNDTITYPPVNEGEIIGWRKVK